MNIVRENLEDLTTLLKVTVGEADYNEAVDKALRTYKRKANIPGFRPGMVPMGIINKMYRKGVVAEESYRAASKACIDYIEKEKLTLVGDMIPSEKQQPLDFDNNTEYEFVFEVGIAPEIAIKLSKKDKITKYNIQIEDKMRDGYRSNFMNRYGKLVDVDSIEKQETQSAAIRSMEDRTGDPIIGVMLRYAIAPGYDAYTFYLQYLGDGETACNGDNEEYNYILYVPKVILDTYSEASGEYNHGQGTAFWVYMDIYMDMSRLEVKENLYI